MENDPFWEAFLSDPLGLLAPFSRPFPKIDFLMHFGRPLAHFGLPFGSPWLPFGTLWLTFGALWLPFGAIWLPFGTLWLTFGTLWLPLGPFWLPLASFWLTFGVFWLTFNISRSLFSYFYVLSMKMSCKIVFFFLKDFRHPISQNTCRLIEGSTLRKALFLCTASSPTWPGAEPWLCQLR